jgi:hypothetical protein
VPDEAGVGAGAGGLQSSGNNLAFQFSIKVQLRLEFDRSLDVYITGKNVL